MRTIFKRLFAGILLLLTGGLIARGGHGGHGGHAGHHRGHHGHRGGHHGGRHHPHRISHGNRMHHNRGWHRGGWGRSGWGWGYGWGFGFPSWWLWGATAALVAGTWYYGGYTIDEWQTRAAQNPNVNNYYTTVVQPAYEQYQANPNSLQDRKPIEKG